MPLSLLPLSSDMRLALRSALVTSSLLAGLAVTVPMPVHAQSPRPKPTAAETAPAVSSEPGSTTATYGDWLLRCQRLGGETTGRVCEVSQTIQAQGQTAPVAQIALGRLPGQESMRLTVLLPANVSFPSSVRVAEVKDAKNGLDLAWRRCIPGACVADGATTDAVLSAWRKAEDAGRIAFKDADGREVAVSLRGLGPALDALGKEKI